MHLGLDVLFLIPDETGGRETYARELIPALFASEPELVATAFVGRDATGALIAELQTMMRVVRVPISARRPGQWAFGELVRLPVAGRRAGIDVLHSLANFAPASGAFRRVITLHDLQYRAVPELLTRTRRIGTAAVLEPAARRADRIITVSDFSRSELIDRLGIAGDRIDVIPNGLGATLDPIPVPEREVRERHRLGTRAVVLAVASDLPHKNLDALVAALAFIPRVRRPILVIIGPGTDRERLQARARQAEVEEDVRLLGFRPAAELEGLYALASCAVLPSFYEGFGLPVLEAMSRGVPVACSDIPALREVSGDAALHFDPARASEIAAAVDRLIVDRELARRLADAGRRQAARFSWRTTAKATLATYRRALGDGGGPSR
jgi:glycosyltransferase involved in cell wall biosynthesis